MKGVQWEDAVEMIGYYELIMAATALDRGSQVARFNRRYFDLVPGLDVVEPKRDRASLAPALQNCRRRDRMRAVPWSP